MGIRQDIESDYHAALAALSWQLDLGADEAICDAPISAYDLPEKAPFQARAVPAASQPAAVAKTPAQPPQAVAKTTDEGAILAATRAAAQCSTIAELDTAAASFDLCPMRKLARKAVGTSGHGSAHVLVICDPPSIDTEKEGRVFTPPEAALFDRIFAAIGLSVDGETRESGLMLSPAIPWPLRGNSEDQTSALAMMRPFALRRIELLGPKAVVIMGHAALEMLIRGQSLTRSRGTWHDLGGARALPMLPPRSLMQTPLAKRDAWADVLQLKAALRG
jgi:uracil-DNA glycosylase